MATAMSADRTTMSQLTKSIAELTSQLTAKDTEISTLRTRLHGNDNTNNNNNRSNRTGNNSNRSNNSNNSNNNRNNDRNGRTFRFGSFTDRGGYCWTHGFRVSKEDHTSASCETPGRGHQVTATRNNIMGGSTYGQPKT
jgi:hypothetical protein